MNCREALSILNVSLIVTSRKARKIYLPQPEHRGAKAMEAVKWLAAHGWSVVGAPKVVRRKYRVTRPDLYLDPKCAGYADTRARQGHYYLAVDTEDVMRQARLDFPYDSRFSVDATGEVVEI